MGITTHMDEAVSSASQSQLIGYHRTPNHDIEIFQSVASVTPEWQILENCSNDPFSSRLWAESWYKAYENKPGYEPVIILGKSKTGRPEFILPLVKKKFGPFNLLMRPGQKHSTYYHGLYSDEFRAQFAYKNPKQFWPLVFSFIPRLDAVILDGICSDPQTNPLSYLPLIQSSNSAFSMELQACWDGQYQDMTSSKARRNDRRCKTRLADLGKLEFDIAKNAETKAVYLQELMDLKADQFEKMGVHNAYKAREIQAAYQLLAETPANLPDQEVILSAIKLDGKLLAASLGVKHKLDYHGLILAMTTGEYRKFSPGRLLLLELNDHLSRSGVRTHDFGTGSSIYKLNWCNQETTRYNAIAPLSIKGRALTPVIRLAARNKGWLKEFKAVKWAYFNLYKG